MHLRISTLLLGGFLIGFTTAVQPSTTPSDRIVAEDLYIDDEAEIEGSGGGREMRGELEASGSGLGPDDEDGKDDQGVSRDVILDHHPRESTIVPPVWKNNDHTAGPDNTLPNNKITDNGVSIMDTKPEDRPTSFFAQPGILAAVIGGAVVGLLCAILVVMFIVYRMRKKDEGSYPLDEPKRPLTGNTYAKGNNREFYA